MLTQKSRYALRALQHLADRFGEGPVQLASIADTQNIPRKFLTVILSELAREGIVGSRRGKDGGYWLAAAPEAITYARIVRLTSGSLALLPCASRSAYESCTNCVDEETCRLRRIMLAVRDATADVLDRVTLADPMPPDGLPAARPPGDFEGAPAQREAA
jgi:Rrf2 family protein